MSEKLPHAIQHAYANATAVKKRFDDAGIEPASIRTVADLARVPVLAKDDVIAMQQADPPFGGLLAVPPEQVRHIFFSPGPLYEPDAGDDATMGETAVYALKAAGFGPGDIVLNALSYHLVPAGLLVDGALLAAGCTVVPGGVGNSDLQVKMMADLGITAYAGTPSFLMILIKKAEEMGLDFRRDLKVTRALVTAEPLPGPLRQTLVDNYGLTIANAYATAELGLLALNTGEGMAMQLLPGPITQIVDPDTGEEVPSGAVGEVVVTNFSDAYPLIRLGTGDMAVNLDPNPGASRQEERAIILVGRRGEAAKVRGMFVHPNQLRFAIAPLVSGRVQGVVSRPGTSDHFVVRIATDSPDESLVEPIMAAVRQACRVRADAVEFVAADAIAADAPGMVDARDWS